MALLRNLWICGLWILFPGLLMAQAPYFQSYTLFKKSEKTEVFSVLHDQDGFIWFGTNQGVFQSDGSTHHRFTPQDSTVGIEITAMAQDTNGIIWLGHKTGSISTMSDGEISTFTPPEGMPAQEISDLLVDADGRLWIATLGEGIYFIQDNRMYSLSADEGLPDNYVYDLEMDDQQRVWAGTDGGIGICTLNGTEPSVTVLAYDQGLPDNIIQRLHYDSTGSMWLGTADEGPVRYDLATEKIQHPIMPGFWRYGGITGLAIKHGDLWIGTARKGLVVWDPESGEKHAYGPDNGFDASAILTIYLDREGNLWAGTRQDVWRTAGNELEFIRRFGESSSRNVLALQPARDGSLWYITDDGLFRRRLNAAGWVMIEPYLKQRPYLDYTLISLYQDPWDNLWVGTFGNGLIWLNPESGETKLYKDELGNGNILGLTGKEDQIWLATLGGATQISIAENGLKAARNYMASDGLNTNYIYQVFIDSRDRVWFGTDGNGIGLMEEGKFTSFKVRDTDSEVIYSFAEDGNGNIWINSLGQGLYRYDGRLFDNLGLDEGLRDVNIGAIQSDVNGNIVAIHEQGIDVYSLENNRFHPLGEEIGLRDMIPNLNAVAKDDFDNLWFGTEHGVIRYSDVLGNRISRPRPFIHQIKLFQDPIDLMKSGSSLGYNENNLTIEYIGFWYQSPENLNFRYRLDNYELEWIQSRNRSVTYSSLPPGEYIFRLQVSETENFDNAYATSYKLTIRPPFWERTWFYVVTVLGIIIIVLGFVKFRERSLLTAKRNLEMKVEERTREIAAQNVQIQAKNEEITEKNRNITESITYAERIQTAILPLSEKINTCFPEHFILYKPRDIVSGDFYWFYEDGDLLYLAAIDCTGHGVPGALMSMIGYSLLNGILANQPGLTPAYVLDQLDQGVINSFKKDEVPESARARPNDGMDMAMVRYNRATRELIYSGAKRPLYHILNGELTEIKGDKNAIGGSRNDEDGIAFQDHVVEVEVGSMVYIFSDGYPDQFGGPQNKKFMLRQFKNMLLDHHQLPVVEQRRIYDERLTAWKKEQSQTDDILLIGLRF